MAGTEAFTIKEQEVVIKSTGKVASLRDKAMRQATKQGFMTLLKRMTPRYTWSRHSDVLAIVDTDRILQKSSLISEEQTDVYTLVAELHYDRQAVLDVLKKMSIPFTEKLNPRTLMLPVYKGEGRKETLWGSNNPWKIALSEEAKNSGMNEIVFPVGDIHEVTKLTPQMASLGAEDIILEIASIYETAQAIVASVEIKYGFVGRLLDIEGNVYGNGHVEPFYLRLPYGEDVTLEQVLKQAAQAFYAKLEEDRQQDTLVEVDRPDRIFLRYHPTGIRGLIDLEETIKGIDRIRSYRLRVVSVEDSIFQVDFYGDKDKFRQQLEAAGLTIIPTSMPMVWGVEHMGQNS